MARTKEFDREQALHDGMQLFWSQGYSATSVQQLLNVMKLSRSSMYSEFGNKRELFLLALELYNIKTENYASKISVAENAVEAVRNLYEIGFAQIPNSVIYRGCLLVNTILEMRDVDDELSKIAAGYFDQFEQALADCFQKCVELGTLKSALQPTELARFYITVLKGMRVAASQQASDEYLQSVIETALLVFKD